MAAAAAASSRRPSDRGDRRPPPPAPPAPDPGGQTKAPQMGSEPAGGPASLSVATNSNPTGLTALLSDMGRDGEDDDIPAFVLGELDSTAGEEDADPRVGPGGDGRGLAAAAAAAAAAAGRRSPRRPPVRSRRWTPVTAHHLHPNPQPQHTGTQILVTSTGSGGNPGAPSVLREGQGQRHAVELSTAAMPYGDVDELYEDVEGDLDELVAELPGDAAAVAVAAAPVAATRSGADLLGVAGADAGAAQGAGTAGASTREVDKGVIPVLGAAAADSAPQQIPLVSLLLTPAEQRLRREVAEAVAADVTATAAAATAAPAFVSGAALVAASAAAAAAAAPLLPAAPQAAQGAIQEAVTVGGMGGPAGAAGPDALELKVRLGITMLLEGYQYSGRGRVSVHCFGGGGREG